MSKKSLKNNVCEENVYQNIFFSVGKNLRDFIYYKCGEIEQANDIVQDVFIKLWEKCKDVSIDKAKSFLFTAANNLFLNEVKHKKIKQKYAKQIQFYNKIEKEDPQFKMEENQFKLKLETAINNLPEGQKEVFLLNRINKMTYREIADSLGVSQKAVEKRMSKALLKLKDILNPK